MPRVCFRSHSFAGEESKVREFTIKYAERWEEEDGMYGGVESLRQLEDALLEQEILDR